MKKYLYIFKSEVMTSLQYILDNIFGFIGYFIMIFIFLNLWRYIYSDPGEIINGYTMNQMIWYVIITEILWSVMSGRKFCKSIINDVRSGNIAYNINKPYNYISYCISSHLGECFIRAIVYILLAFITGYLFLGEFPNITISSFILVIIVGILSLVINTLIVIFIGLFSFIIEDSSPFYWIYSKLLLVLGTIFPIEFFPERIRCVLEYSPIYVLSYGPAKLFVDFSFSNFISILTAQIIYVLISYLLCLQIYKKGVKNLNVNGG